MRSSRPPSHRSPLHHANQRTRRSVPGFTEVLGRARAEATVTANDQPALRQEDYFRVEVPVDNAAGLAYQEVIVRAVWNDGQQDLFKEESGRVLLPPAVQYQWGAENRLIRLVTATAAGPRRQIDLAYDWQGRRRSRKVWNTAGSGAPVLDLRFL